MPTVEEQEQNYREYIDTHRANVKKAYEKIVRPYAEKYLSPQSVEILDRNIEQHDEDKDIDFIFQAYRKDHFPVDELEKEASQEEYEIAWNYHKKVNPHHWEFFLDDNDEEFTNPELMEEEEEIYKLAYLEMLADWLSFTFKLAQDQIGKGDDIHTSGDSLEFDDWYNKNKDTIKIHPQLQTWFNPIVQKVISDLKKDNSVLYEKKKDERIKEIYKAADGYWVIDLNPGYSTSYGTNYIRNKLKKDCLYELENEVSYDNPLSEGIIRAEKYREDNNTFLIQSDKGFLAVNPKALSYKIKFDYEEATLFDNMEEARLMLTNLMNKYKILRAVRVISIANLEKDMKENPNRYNFRKEIEIAEQEREENHIFSDNSEDHEGETEISQAIFQTKDDETEDFSIYED